MLVNKRGQSKEAKVDYLPLVSDPALFDNHGDFESQLISKNGA